MSLSAWEQKSLDSIKDGLAGSAPELAAMLTTFSLLATGEEMPVQEDILADSRQTIMSPSRPARHRCRTGACPFRRPGRRRLDARWTVLLVWLVITITVIMVALALSHGGGSHGRCGGSWPTICGHSSPG